MGNGAASSDTDAGPRASRSRHLPAAGIREAAERWISERRTTWERRLDRLGEVLAGAEQAG